MFVIAAAEAIPIKVKSYYKLKVGQWHNHMADYNI